MDTPPQSAPPRWLLVASLLLCLAGLGVAGDLTRIHYGVHTDPQYVSFCAISKEVNCDTVALSDYSVFLGLPVSVWGLIGYLVMGVLCAWGLSRRSLGRAWPWGLMFLLTTFSVAVALVLLVISKVFIKSVCVMCIASWGVSLALFVLTLIAVRKVGLRAALREDFRALLEYSALTLTLAVVALALLGAVWTLYPRYWDPSGLVGPGTLRTGVGEHGSPWIGAEAPALTVEEFSDYECPFCSQAHRRLRQMVEKRSDRVRLVHRNFPLDNACNPIIKGVFHRTACERAKAAICAGEQGKFWEMNDLLFLRQKERGVQVEHLASLLKLDPAKFAACLTSEPAAQHLKADLEAGASHSVKGTPTYVIGGEVLKGRLTEEELDKRLNAAK